MAVEGRERLRALLAAARDGRRQAQARTSRRPWRPPTLALSRVPRAQQIRAPQRYVATHDTQPPASQGQRQVENWRRASDSLGGCGSGEAGADARSAAGCLPARRPAGERRARDMKVAGSRLRGCGEDGWREERRWRWRRGGGGAAAQGPASLLTAAAAAIKLCVGMLELRSRSEPLCLLLDLV